MLFVSNDNYYLCITLGHGLNHEDMVILISKQSFPLATNGTGSGSIALEVFSRTVFELSEILRITKLSKKILYKNKKHKGSALQGFEN